MSAAPVSAAAENVVCRFTDKRFTEISGLTTSLRHPGVLYLHNDSGDGPYIYAVDSSSCTTLATLTVRGIDPRDVEAISIGRDAQGRSVIWFADIGDNLDSWPDVRLHQIREPKRLRDKTVSATTFQFTYGDIYLPNEQQFSAFELEVADVATCKRQFEDMEREVVRILGHKGRQGQSLALPAYDHVLKASHLFNIMDARGAIAVAERQSYIGRVRDLTKMCAEAWVGSQGGNA